MTDFLTPFWLASSLLEENQSILDWLKTQRIQARWIDEVIFLGAPTDSGQIPGVKEEVLLTTWKDPDLSEQYFLHQACRELALNERNLILLVSTRNQIRTVVLLASPGAVGMYNLLPQAYLTDWLQFKVPAESLELLAVIESALERKHKKAPAVKELLLVQSDGKRPVKSGSGFAGAGWVPVVKGAGMLAQCHSLVAALTEKQQTNGMAVDIDPDRNLFLTWIERV